MGGIFRSDSGWGIGRNFWGSQKESKDALANYNWGMGTAKQDITSKYDASRGKVASAYGSAKKTYNESPGVVASRKELYDRVMGKGGYSPETVNSMKGNTIEQAGVQQRDVANSLNDRFGDASGGGMTGENLARAMTTIGANKANALRDVDIQNALLQEQQQTEAMPLTFKDAAETGNYDINAALAEAGLTTEEAKALAELESSRASSNLQVGTQKNLLQSLWG